MGLLVAGATAGFVTDNGTGSAALVSIGAALLLPAGLCDRLESFEFAGAKMQMRIVERLRDRAAEAEARGDAAVAAALREEGATAARRGSPDRGFIRTTARVPGVWPRTDGEVEQLVAKARAAARETPRDPAEVRQLFERGDEGERIYALGLMEEDERLRDFAVSLEAIEHSQSAFEQYHALYLAELMLPALTKDQRRKLKAMLTKRPGNAAYIRPGTDRWSVAQQILSSLTSA